MSFPPSSATALAWTAVHVASPAAAGAVVAAGTLPRAVILLLGGALADHLNSRRIVVVTNVIRVIVLVVVSLGAAGSPTSITLLLLAAIAFGSCDAMYDPAASTIARQLVRPDDLTAYMGVAQTAARLGTMVGAAVGGALVAHAGLPGGAMVNAVTFSLVTAVAAIWLVPRFALPRAEAEPPWRGIVRGFEHLRAQRTTRTLVLALSGLNLAIGPALGLGLALRAQEQGWGAVSVGWFEALVGLGAMVGALTVVRRRPSHPARAGFAALVVQGGAIGLLGLGPRWLVAASCLTIGVTAGYASALLSAVFAATVSGAYFGRMVSIQRLGDDCLMPLATAGFGALAAASAIWVPFAAYGLAMAFAVALPLRNNTIRSLKPGGVALGTSNRALHHAVPRTGPT